MQSKRVWWIPALAFAACAGCLFTSGGMVVTRADESQVLALHREYADTMHSAHWCTYVGESARYVYLEHGTMVHSAGLSSGEPRVTLYYASKAELSEQTLDKIRRLKRP